MENLLGKGEDILSWEYRVVRKDTINCIDEEVSLFRIAEVYYDDDTEKISGYTDEYFNPLSGWNSEADLIDTLVLIDRALCKSTLVEKNEQLE